MKRYLSKVVFPFLAVILIWEAAALLLNQPFFPTVTETMKALAELIVQGKLNIHLWASFYRIAAGTICGFVVSLPVGIFLGTSPTADRLLGGILNILYPIPKVVFLPIIIVFMGIGDTPKIFLIALVLFFQLTIVIRDAAKNIPADLKAVMQSMKANKLQMIYHLVIPGCMPEILTSVRSTIGVSTAMLFITENFASFTGLGYFIQRCMDSREYEKMYAAVLVLGVLGVALYSLVGLIGYICCPWMRNTIRENNRSGG